MNEHDPIISFLLEEKVVSPEDLQPVLAKHEETGEGLLRLLQQEKLVDDEQIARAVAVVNDLDFVNLSPEMIDPLVAHLISHDMANRHSLIPLRREDGQLIVAMSAPLDLRARDEVELKTGYRVVPVAATPQAVQQAIHYHFDVANVTKQAIASMRLKGQSGPGTGDEGSPIGPAGGSSLDSGPGPKRRATTRLRSSWPPSSGAPSRPAPAISTSSRRPRSCGCGTEWTGCSAGRWRSRSPRSPK